MSERKYRQSGYQDNGPTRVERPRKPPEPGPPKGAKRDSLRVIRMPGFQEVLRCALCGAVVSPPLEVSAESRCPKCKADLWSCKNCRYFDTAAQFECTQPITERITKKDVRNECTFYVPRTSVERETRDSGGGFSGRPTDARAAFDNLFRK